MTTETNACEQSQQDQTAALEPNDDNQAGSGTPDQGSGQDKGKTARVADLSKFDDGSES